MEKLIFHLAGLIQFAGQVGASTRMYSAYNHGAHGNEQFAPDDICFLSDTLVNFEHLGECLHNGDHQRAMYLCDDTALKFQKYIDPPAHFNGRGTPTFQRNPSVNLAVAIKHLEGIKACLTK